MTILFLKAMKPDDNPVLEGNGSLMTILFLKAMES